MSTKNLKIPKKIKQKYLIVNFSLVYSCMSILTIPLGFFGQTIFENAIINLLFAIVSTVYAGLTDKVNYNWFNENYFA